MFDKTPSRRLCGSDSLLEDIWMEKYCKGYQEYMYMFCMPPIDIWSGSVIQPFNYISYFTCTSSRMSCPLQSFLLQFLMASSISSFRMVFLSSSIRSFIHHSIHVLLHDSLLWSLSSFPLCLPYRIQSFIHLFFFILTLDSLLVL